MILLIAILLGLLSGMVRAELGKRHYRIIQIRAPGLVFLAFIPQLLLFQIPRFGIFIQDLWISIVLVCGQILLLVFVTINWKKPGFFLLGIGTVLNLAAFLANGGLMPMEPSTITTLYPTAPMDSWSIGHHLWNSKNIVLTREMMHLSFLSDQFIVPAWSPYRVAFSMGDIILAIGAFWLFWSLGGKPRQYKENNYGKVEHHNPPIRKDRGKSSGKGILPDTYSRSD